jgi:hypothetical protein
MHTYANGQKTVAQGNDRGAHFGSIARVGCVISDGDNIELVAAKLQLACIRAYNVGGDRDGLVITGNNVSIGMLDLQMWPKSVGRKAVIIHADGFQLGQGSIAGAGTDNDGLSLSGGMSSINVHIANFNAANRIGLQVLNSSYGDLRARIENCNVGLLYVPGNHNRLSIDIWTNANQTPARGAPGASDHSYIRWGGATSGVLGVP